MKRGKELKYRQVNNENLEKIKERKIYHSFGFGLANLEQITYITYSPE